MKLKKLRKIGCAVTMASVFACSSVALSACGSKDAEGVSSVSESSKENADSGKNKTADNIAGTETTAKSGDQSVYVKAAPDGSVKSIEIEDDTYKPGEKEIPVDVSVSYYLNDKKISPEEIAGKSGNVKIRFDYQNRTGTTEQTAGTAYRVQAPMLVLTALLLDEEKFSNIEVENGKLIEMDNQTIVTGYALPGLSESLDLDNLLKDSDTDANEDTEITIPDHVEVTADVTDFTLDFTASIVTNGLFADLDTDTLEDLDELSDSADKLKEASSKLADGSGNLLDGTKKLKDGVAAFGAGVDALGTGIDTLNQGMKTLQEKQTLLEQGAGSLTEGLKKLSQAQSDMDAAATAQAKAQAGQAVQQALADNNALSQEEKEAIQKQVEESISISGLGQQEALEQLYQGAQGLEDGIRGYGSGISALADGALKLKNGSDQLKGYQKQITDGMNALLDGTGALSDGMKKLDEEGIAKIQRAAGKNLGELTGRLRTLKAADRDYGIDSGYVNSCEDSVRFIIETEEIKSK